MEQMNLFYISQCTKACPNCKFIIQKIDGCNKMTCSRCGIYFCWMCVNQIQGYDHFRESPQCGDIIAAQINESLEIESNFYEKTTKDIVAEALENCINCPNCRELLSKISDVNLLSCYKCKSQFCYLCGRLSPEGKEHFEITNCYYETPLSQKQKP